MLEKKEFWIGFIIGAVIMTLAWISVSIGCESIRSCF